MDIENKFKKTMAALAAVYQNKITPEMITVYWTRLSKFNPVHIELAAAEHMDDPEEGRFFPKPAHLIKYINEYMATEKREKMFKDQEAKQLEKPVRTIEQMEVGYKALKKMKESL